MLIRVRKILLILVLAFLCSANNVWAVNHYEIGKGYYKKGDYLKAYVQFKKALTSNPQNVNYRYYYAQTLVYIYNLEEAQRQYEKIIELAPLSDAAKLSSMAIVKIHKHILGDEEEEESASNDVIGENYIDNAQDGGRILHWNPEKAPLKVCIANSTGVAGYKPYYTAGVKEALDSWMSNLNGLMSYTFVSDPRLANINIKFAGSISQKGTNEGKSSFLSGLTTPRIKGSILEGMQIDLLSIKPNNQSFTESEMYNTTLHELGHSLGIRGHSFNEGDIMYPVAKANESKAKLPLSRRDINTIRLLYKLDADISNFDSDRIAGANSGKNSAILGGMDSRLNKKLKEAQDYVKQVPDHPIGWDHLGDAYLDKKDYQNAVLNYKKALELDSKYKSSKEGLADAYSAMGDNINAVKQYTELISSDPKNVNYSLNLGSLYAKNGQYQQAGSVLNSLINSNPDAANDQNVIRMLNLLNRRK